MSEHPYAGRIAAVAQARAVVSTSATFLTIARVPFKLKLSTPGNRKVWHEFRVTGAGRYGQFDHGWQRHSADRARAHAVEMVGHEGIYEVYLEHRIVDAEVLDVERVVAEVPAGLGDESERAS